MHAFIHRTPISRHVQGLASWMPILFVLLTGLFGVAAETNTPPRSIIVASDDTYPPYIVLAAKKGEIDVFSVDKPAGDYDLAHYGIANDFRQAFILYTGSFHRAVRKVNAGLLKWVEAGFAAIPAQTYKTIERKWLEPDLDVADIPWHGRYFFLGVIGVILALIITIFLLSHKERKSQSALTASQQLLEENHALMKQFLLHSPIHNFIREITADGDRFVMASENFKDILGRSGASMIGQTVQKTFPAALAEKIVAEDDAVMKEGRVVKSEFTLDRRHYTATKYPITLGKKTLLAGFIVDITDRVKAARGKSEAITRYHTLARQNGIVTWEIDLDGRFTNLSEEITAVTGLHPEDLIGQACFHELHPRQGREAFRRNFMDNLNKGEPLQELVHPATGRDNTRIWFSSSSIPLSNDDGSLKGAWGTSRNVTERIHMEQIRQESENRYRVLTENMKDVVWILDADTLEYRYLSPSVEKVLGHTPDELLGRHVHSTLFPRQAEVFEKQIRSMKRDFHAERLTAETFFITELRQSRKTGKPIVTEVIVHFWMNHASGKLEVHGSTRNIDERKRVEQALRESQRKYAALLGRLPGMAYRRRFDENWTMEFVSSGCRAVTGHAAEDLLNNANVSYLACIKPELLAGLREKWDLAVREHKRFEAEYQIRSKSGDWRWVWERAEVIYGPDGEPLGVEGFVSDITDRRQAEAEIHRLLSAIEQTGEAIIITDTSASIIYVNPSFCKVSGYTREEVLGKTPRILKSGRQSDAFYREMWETLQSGRIWSGKFENKRKDGTLFTEAATISPAFDEEGHIVSYIAVKRDICEQLASEKEKADLQTQLMQSQKLESVGRLAGGIAHDFNNILQAIIGYTEMALMQVSNNQPLTEDLQEIKKAAMRSTHLTRQLLTFARKQPVDRKETQIKTVIDGMMNMLYRMVGETITLEFLPGNQVDTVMIDAGQLEQIVFNLCINARDAMPKAGTLQIRTANTTFEADAPNLPKALKPGRYVELSVSDQGVGIPDHILERIFEPFFTTKALGEGTGLGLSVVYGIVTQTGGTITIDSEVNHGSTFHLYFPSHGAATKTVDDPDGATATGRKQSFGILVVDDEELILKPAKHLLESLGHHVYAANSASEAVGLLGRHTSRIDLVITDVMMPRMNGPEMIREIQKVKRDIKYIFMSGHTANLIEKQGLKQSSDNFIEKPFSRQKLDAIINKVMV